MFGAIVAAGDFQHPDRLAARLVMLYDGANISAQMDHNAAVVAAARDAAADLLDTAGGTRR